MQPREEIADARAGPGQADPQPVQQAQYRYGRAEVSVQLERFPVPIVDPQAHTGRDMHDGLQQHFDDHAGSEPCMQQARKWVVLRACRTHRWVPATKACSRRSNSAGWSKNTAWAAWSTAT